MSRNMKILLGILGVGFIVSVNLDVDKKKESEKQRIAAMTPEQKAANEKRITHQAVAAEVAKKIKNAMKDPQAFELTSLVVMPNGSAFYEYRDKNSFGAIELVEFLIELQNFHNQSTSA
jgi:hypothetical protein